MKQLSFLFLLLLTTLMPRSGLSQEIPINADDFMQHAHESMAKEIEEELEEDSLFRTADEDFEVDWEEILRTSDIEGEMPTQNRSNGSARPKPKGKRIGSLCMDGTESENAGRGACSGHGGVRYWLYEHEGEVEHYATRRHYEHPDPYTDSEKMGLAAYGEKAKDKKEEAEQAEASAARTGLPSDFYWMMTVLIICMTAAYLGNLYFTGKNV